MSQRNLFVFCIVVICLGRFCIWSFCVPLLSFPFPLPFPFWMDMVVEDGCDDLLCKRVFFECWFPSVFPPVVPEMWYVVRGFSEDLVCATYCFIVLAVCFTAKSIYLYEMVVLGVALVGSIYVHYPELVLAILPPVLVYPVGIIRVFESDFCSFPYYPFALGLL